MRAWRRGGGPKKGTITLRIQVRGKRPISNLTTALSSIEGAHEVSTVDGDVELD
jgi:hypothetical protein